MTNPQKTFILLLLVVLLALTASIVNHSTNAPTQIDTSKFIYDENGNSIPADEPIHTIVSPLSMEIEDENDACDDDIYWLARGMQDEDGVGWSDEDILKIGTVIANRRDRDDFPNTYKEVLLQYGQYEPYSWAWNATDEEIAEHELEMPLKKYIILAMIIDSGYRSFDEDVVYQSQYVLGPIVYEIYDSVLDTTTYFCEG